MRVVFMGTARFAVPSLEALIASGHDIVAVVTQPDRPSGRGRRIHDSPVKARALAAAFPIHQPATLKDGEIRQVLSALEPDLGVVVAYGQIVPEWLRDLPRFGVVNVHGSLLPRHRGAAPVNWAIIVGDTETGVSVMEIDAGLDTGPVYATRSTPIDPDETAVELYERLAGMGGGLLAETVGAIGRGDAQLTPQESALATMAPRLTREDGYIRWTEPARAIHNRVRGLVPWPAVTVGFRGSPLKLLETRRSRRSFSGPRGGIVKSGSGVFVVCGDGEALELLRVQPESRRPVSGSEFANGIRLRDDERFTPWEKRQTTEPATKTGRS